VGKPTLCGCPNWHPAKVTRASAQGATTSGLTGIVKDPQDAVIPGATVPVFAATAVWMLVATIVAVRQALDYRSTARAVAVCALGWLLALAVAMALGLFFGPTLS